jgi:hypothetical protein
VNEVARGIFELEASWTAFAKGFFRLDHSLLGGTDTLGVSQTDPRWSGEFDQVGRVVDARWQRGQINADGRTDGGTATFTVRDREGLYNPENPASPLYGLLGERLHPIRFRGRLAGGPRYGLFAGWIKKIAWKPTKRTAVAVFDCVDLFYWLQDAKPVIAATGPTTVGAAIGIVLETIGLRDPAMRRLDAGDAIPDFAADGSKTGLQIIQELLMVERGRFTAAGDGAAVFDSRHAVATRPSMATIANEMRALDPEVDAGTVANMITVTRQGGVAQQATDLESRNRYGDRELSPITSSYLLTDEHALALGRHIVGLQAAPRPRVRTLDIDNRTADLLEQLLARDLGHVITASEGTLGTAGDYAIDTVSGSTDGRRATVAWTLARKPFPPPFVIGTSLLGGPDPLVY